MANEKVLVVDDEEDFVDFISTRLEAKGFHVLRAFNGKEGLERIYSDKPDLVILDITMPEMNGYDVCMKMRLDERLKKIPIIVMTARFQPNDIDFGKKLGSDIYMTKPVDLTILLQNINMLLKK